jgi:prevent-host-death family protein
MKTMTATEASRHFSDLLDAVERGERVIILRGSHPVAEIGPAQHRTGADLRAALEGSPPPDESFTREISAALGLVTSEVPDPWAGG